MNPSAQTVTTYVWDVPTPTEEEVELLISALGYHWDEIFYMTSIEEPTVSSVEVSDVLPEFKIERTDND